MKKLLVLFVALAVASTAFAADFSFSWDTDWGWAGNLDDEYTTDVDELELAVTADIDEYNAFAIQIEPGTAMEADSTSPLFYDYFKITTDLGAYLGLSGVGVSWVNGYTDPGDEEYADVLRVGEQNAGLDKADLSKDWTTNLILDFDAFWVSIGSNWNLGAADAADGTEYRFFVNSVDAIEGLSVEAGVKMFDDGTDDGNIFEINGAYVFAIDDATTLTAAGSFANASEGMLVAEAADYTFLAADVYLDQLYGAGFMVDYMVDDMTALNVGAEFSGDDDEAFRVMAGGVGLAYGDLGVDVDMAYAMTEAIYENEDGEIADGELLGVDMSGYVSIGMVTFRVGYSVTDFGWSNNSNGGMPTDGGAYMTVLADF